MSDGHLAAGGSAHVIDAVDRLVIQELVADGRISMRSLADRVHISRANAYARVEKLRKEGVIQAFSARIDYERAGFTASAFVALSIRQDSWRGVSDGLRLLPYVHHVALLGGDVDVLVVVRAPNNHALRRVVLENLQSIDGVLSTKTWLIFEEAVDSAPLWDGADTDSSTSANSDQRTLGDRP